MMPRQYRFKFGEPGVCWIFPAILILGCSVESPGTIASKDGDQAIEDTANSSRDLESLKSKMTGPKSGNSDNISDKTTDQDYRHQILGSWQDDYQGKRTLTFREDGSATMVVEPDGLAAKLYAEQMIFEEEWYIEEGRLKMKAVGGEPQARVNLVLKTMGNTANYIILELSENRMLLQDADGKTKYDWRRPDSE